MQGQPNLNCKQLEEALDAYYDLELSPEEAEAVEQHLADCANCTAKLADIDLLVTQLKRLPAVEWGGDLSDAIEARILASASSPESKLESKAESKPEVKAESKAENIVSINSGSISQSQSQSIARSLKVVGFLKPRYILASAASILALVFAYNLAITPTPTPTPAATATHAPLTELAQVPVHELLPSVKEVTGIKGLKELSPKLKGDNAHELASTNEKKENHKAETTTEKMLANNRQGDQDNNKNNVADSEEIVAAYDFENIDSASDFGINTNEDGLYAIKL